MNPKIFTLFGVPCHFHITFIIFMAAICVTNPWLSLYFLATFGCVLLHEYGHVLGAKYYGINTRSVTMLPLGGIAQLERMPRESTQELVIALSGPAVNFILGIWSLPFALITWGMTDFFLMFAVVNGVLLFFNLLPIFPMDGGRVLRALLHYGMSYEKATLYAVRTGQVMAAVLIVIGILTMSFLLVITMILVGMMGEYELRNVKR